MVKIGPFTIGRNPQLHRSITDSLITVENLKVFLAKQKCPNCTKNGDFFIVSQEQGRKGWEARLRCKGCGTIAVINNTGFHFEMTEREESK